MKSIDTKKLLDSFQVIGTDNWEELMSELKDMSSSIRLLQLNSKQIQLMTVQSVTDGEVLGFLHNLYGTKQTPITKKEFANQVGDPVDLSDLLSETEASSHMMFRLGTGVFFATRNVLKTLCQRAGSTMGDFALRNELKIRFHRDAGYVEYMNCVPSNCQVLYRQVGSAKKIFAVFTDRYKVLPQDQLITSLKSSFEAEMGRADLKHFCIDNFDTEIYMEFPDKARDFAQVYNLKDEVVPGLRVHLSDVGESSFIVNGTIRMGSKAISYIPEASFSRAHTKKADLNAISEAVGERVFGEYTKMPERMVDLLQIDVVDPVALLPKVFEYCKIKSLGSKFEAEMLKTLTDGINPNIPYTAYEIAAMIMDYCAESEADRSGEFVTSLRQTAVKALFYKYD